jgi:hypothetical protein
MPISVSLAGVADAAGAASSGAPVIATRITAHAATIGAALRGKCCIFTENPVVSMAASQ